MQQGIKIDVYTKIILTIIAGCLVLLIVQNTLTPAQAQSENIIDVRIKEVDVGDAETLVGNQLPVRVMNTVNVSGHVAISGFKHRASSPR